VVIVHRCACHDSTLFIALVIIPICHREQREGPWFLPAPPAPLRRPNPRSLASARDDSPTVSTATASRTSPPRAQPNVHRKRGHRHARR
jgi:hypothetical protein